MTEFNWFIKDGSDKERTGVLMKLEENTHSRYEFEVWFEYTRRAMNDIREGTMMAVPNYATTKDETHYSILEVTSIKPIHYAIGEDPQGYPGFVLEAAKNAAQDWTGQDDESTEDTTTIRCIAIPTNLELVEHEKGQRSFQTEENIPMVGALVYILDTEPTKQVINRDIDLETEKDLLFIGGTLIRNFDVEAFVRVEDFVQVHFAIFGFTGSGKSNLLSTYIAKLLEAKEVIKVVLFDLMGEYTGLVIDLLANGKVSNAYVVALGERTLPGPVVSYLHREKGALSVDVASESLNRVTLLPKKLQGLKPELKIALGDLLQDNRLRIFSHLGNLSIWYLFWDYKNNPNCPLSFKDRRAKQLIQLRKQIIKDVLDKSLKKGRDYEGKKDYKRIYLTRVLGEELLATLAEELNDTEDKDRQKLKQEGDFQGVINQIVSAIPQLDSVSPAAMSLSDIVTDINDDTESSLYVIQAHNPDEMRKFSAWLGEEVYEVRRRSGEIRPLVSFVFDEADEFIPQQASGTYEDSKSIVTTLARRGRKFGLGIGIATQRVRYLDTSIMAQPHTYLVSKLPRLTDRQAVAEAFGVSEDMFRQTFKFKPGNWLIMSHDATGLKAIPVPIQTYDANKRIESFLQSLKTTEQDTVDELEIPF